jgi:hypothetical protein
MSLVLIAALPCTFAEWQSSAQQQPAHMITNTLSMAVCLQGGWVTGSQPTVADDKPEWGVLRHVLRPHKNHRAVFAGVMLSAGHT